MNSQNNSSRVQWTRINEPRKPKWLCAPLFVFGSTSLSTSSVSDRARIKGLRRATTCSAGSTTRRDSELIAKLLLELLGSRAENEWGGVGGVSRAAFGSVDDSIVASYGRGKMHTALESSRGTLDGPLPEYSLGQCCARQRFNQDMQ